MPDELERHVESGDEINTVAGRERAFSVGRDEDRSTFEDLAYNPRRDLQGGNDTAAARFAEASEALSGLAWVERRISRNPGRFHTEPGLPIVSREPTTDPDLRWRGIKAEAIPPEPPIGTVFCYQRLLGGKHYTYVSVRTGDGRWWTTGNSKQGVTWPELVAALREPRVQRPVMLAASWQPYAPLETR